MGVVSKFFKEAKTKITSRPWNETLGKALTFTSKIVDGLGAVVPYGKLIKVPLALAGNILNPNPEEDEKESNQDLDETKQNMEAEFKNMGKEMLKMRSEVKELDGLLFQILEQQIAMRFKDPLGIIEAGHKTFIDRGTSRGLKIATVYLSKNFDIIERDAEYYLGPGMIRQYLEAIPDGEDEQKERVIHYCIRVNAKFLALSSLYHVYNDEDADGVSIEVGNAFEKFNSNYQEYLSIYKDVTGKDLLPEENEDPEEDEDDEDLFSEGSEGWEYVKNAMKEEFDKHDTDGDGALSPSELQAMVELDGEEIDDDEMREVLEELEADEDGNISFENWFLFALCQT